MTLAQAAMSCLFQLQYTVTPSQYSILKFLWIDQNYLTYIKFNILG